MKLIDFHTHIYPDAVAKKATHSVEEFYDAVASHVGTKEELKACMEKAGVCASIILPVAVKPSGVGHINDFSYNVCKEEKSFIPCGTVHAAMEGIEDETERILKLGLHGIKLHPDTQLFSIDDERMYPVYDMIQGKIPLIVHTGDPRYPYSHPERLRRVMNDFPSLLCVGAHFGGWSMAEEGIKYLSDKENCFVDMSSSFDWTKRSIIEKAVSRFGEDRVLFGSDFPLGSPVTEKENLLSLDISDTAKEKIAYKNTERLLGITL